MNKSYSKIRHIQESNRRLEKRFLMEQSDYEYMVLTPGETYEFIPSELTGDSDIPKPKEGDTIKFKVVSFDKGNLTLSDGTNNSTYKEGFVDIGNELKQRYFCLNGNKSECLLDLDGGLTKKGKLIKRKELLDLFGQDTKNEILFDDNNFDDMVLKSTLPVLVDFSAMWCLPCLRIGKYLDEVKTQYKDKLVIAKLDIDISKQTPKKYNVESIPVLLFFKDGKVVERIDGVVSKEELIKVMDSVV